MPIAEKIQNALASSSMIRKMFEEGIVLKKQHGADKVFDFSLGNPDLDPPPEFHRVLVKLAEEDKKGSHGYMPNAGFPDVRAALAQKVAKEQGVDIDASCVIMCCGAAGGLNVVLKAILNPGDEVIVSRPYFMEYRPYIANHGGCVVARVHAPERVAYHAVAAVARTVAAPNALIDGGFYPIKPTVATDI